MSHFYSESGLIRPTEEEVGSSRRSCRRSTERWWSSRSQAWTGQRIRAL